MQAEDIPSRSAVSPAENIFPSARQLFLLLAVYFAAHTVIRTLISGTVDMDEADQLVLTQKLSWGYGPQPPLYSWVQIGFFQVFGVGIFALALWKFILLFATHVLTYFNARFITRSHGCALAAVASLFLFHQFAYESVRDLTHSVLATTLAAATLLAMMRVQQKRTVAGYLLLGACMGLGFLGKYNFVVVAGALVAAGLTLPEYRRAILDWRFALAILVAALIILPNTLWILSHRDLAFDTAYKFRVHEGPWIRTILHGLENLGLATLTFMGPFVGVVGFLLLLQKRNPIRLHTPHEKLILRSLLFTAVGFLMAILFLHTTGFRDRWFQPIFIGVPVLVVAVFRERIDARFVHRISAIAAVVMLFVLILIPTRVVFSEKFDRLTNFNNPYDAFATQMRPSFENVQTVICDEKLVAGNLRLSMPGKIFISPELVSLLADDTNRFGLVWEALKRETLSPDMLDFVRAYGVTNADALSPRLIEAKYKYYHMKMMRMGYAVFDPASAKPKPVNAVP